MERNESTTRKALPLRTDAYRRLADAERRGLYSLPPEAHLRDEEANPRNWIND